MNIFSHKNLGSCLFMAPDRGDIDKEIMLGNRLKWTYNPLKNKKSKNSKISNKENMGSQSKNKVRITKKMDKYTMKIESKFKSINPESEYNS